MMLMLARLPERRYADDDMPAPRMPAPMLRALPLRRRRRAARCCRDDDADLMPRCREAAGAFDATMLMLMLRHEAAFSAPLDDAYADAAAATLRRAMLDYMLPMRWHMMIRVDAMRALFRASAVIDACRGLMLQRRY